MDKKLMPDRETLFFHYTVPSATLDFEYQHLHHAESIKLLERGRLDFMAQRGMPNGTFTERGLFLVLTKLELNFLREVKAGEVKVGCVNPRIEGKTILLDQVLINEKGKIAITATVSMQFMSGSTKRGVEPELEFLEKFRI